MLTNILPCCIAAAAMCLVFFLPAATTVWTNILYIGIASVLYFVVVMLFPQERNIVLNFKSIIKSR